MDVETIVFNPFDAVWREDPYPFFKQLRERAPIGQVPGLPIWYLARYADCEDVLRHPMSSMESRNADVYRQMSEAGIMRLPEDVPAAQGFLFMDPPDHTRLRRLVSQAFTLKFVNGLRPRIQKLVDDLLDAAAERGQLEIIEDLAYPLPFTIISELVGIPVEDLPRWRGWSKAMGGSLDPTMTPPPEVLERQTKAQEEAAEYLRAFISGRRRQPANDLLSMLTAVEEAGDRLSEDELLGTVILLMAAGQETSANLIGNAVLSLLRHPDQYRLLQSDPELARSAVEETLRWDPPIQMTQRIPLDDVDIGGVTIPARSPVILLIASANRDETVSPDGERFDIRRSEIIHLTFGMGIHFCLGAPLGRIEGATALATLARRFPNLRLVEDGLRRRSDLVLRGLESIPVEF